jgi:hypothetical protein
MAEGGESTNEVMLIAGCHNPVTADFAWHCSQRKQRAAVVVAPEILPLMSRQQPQYSAEGFHATTLLADLTSDMLAGLVVFLDRKSSPQQDKLLDELAEICRAKEVSTIIIVSTWRVHLGDAKAADVETQASRSLQRRAVPLVVLRPGNVLSSHARLSQFIHRFGSWLELLPSSFRTCFVDGDALFAAIERERNSRSDPKHRIFTLLGPNKPWNAFAGERAAQKPRAFIQLAKFFTQSFVVQQGALFVFTLLTKWLPGIRAWNVDTLYPATRRELLILHNKYNTFDTKIVGYNNGINHFGQRFPGKTVVSTIRCAAPARIVHRRVKLDAGVTIRDAMSSLAAVGKELCVIPNYSYVSVGTSYFVPIHGSACSFSTLAETIEKVILHDALNDRFIIACRGSREFGEYMYNQGTGLLLLRLYMRVKDKSRYYMQQEQLFEPSSEEVFHHFADGNAANVELRKAGAGSKTVRVCKYYTDAGRTASAGRDLPRDGLGSLWDRLEENRLSSAVFHGLMRRLAHHVELFFSKQQFALFWQTHRSLPIKKIQLRYIKRDGFPHSPFQSEDCISADLFMLKRHREPFNNYLRRQFGAVRMNPGKHSM